MKRPNNRAPDAQPADINHQRDWAWIPPCPPCFCHICKAFLDTRYRSKGIFTVTQLSYTFRPRRTPKRAKNPGRLRYPALQALAIRENTVYINGNACLPDSKAQVYLDIEGLPDTDSYYLISALVVCEGQETLHTFWADQESDEPTMFAQFADAICKLPEVGIRLTHQTTIAGAELKRKPQYVAAR